MAISLVSIGNIDMQTGVYRGGNAIREWRKKGCLGSPPLDKDGNDWNEGAFQYEIMSEYFLPATKLNAH